MDSLNCRAAFDLLDLTRSLTAPIPWVEGIKVTDDHPALRAGIASARDWLENGGGGGATMSEPESQSPATAPEGARIRREDDGTLVLDLAISRDRFLNVFLPVFAFVFFGAGLLLLLRKNDQAGYIPLSIGLLVGWFGSYMAIGRLEIRLGTDRMEWTRVFLKRWSTQGAERGSIGSIATEAGVRTNGKPTSWRLALKLAGKRRLLPGFHGERAILRLGEILALWAQVPFDSKLDRSYSGD